MQLRHIGARLLEATKLTHQMINNRRPINCLPPEILSQILAQAILDRDTESEAMVTLCLTCRRFYDLLLPRLYTHYPLSNLIRPSEDEAKKREKYLIDRVGKFGWLVD